MQNQNDDNSKTINGLVRIDFSKNGVSASRNYELMVVACDPRKLEKVCDFNAKELSIFKQLKNFTFHTTLMTVQVPVPGNQTHGVIFAPSQLENKLAGLVYGFRNETAKTFGLATANQMPENLVTVYQLLGPEKEPYTPEQFAAILEKELPTLDWWPFGTDYAIEKTVTTPYFDHFSFAELQLGTPWEWLNLQGENKTLYVHASTCFESALDCWGYENMLLADGTNSRQALPQNKLAPIAIIGAGVSGLLFAVKLKRLGYTNIDLLEATDRYGGKTHTIKKDGPYPVGSEQPTYCELGTCYLSPAYDAMVEDLKEYHVGNEQIAFGDNVNRGIVTTGQLPASFNPPLVMDYSEYVLRKAEAELGFEPGMLGDFLARAALFTEFLNYIILHHSFFGNSFPMPSTPPQAFLDNHANQNFSEFLQFHNLNGMVGTLQYGYEVQGYGVLDKIPAYYGLVWINPPIIVAIIIDAFIQLADDLGLSIEELLKEILQHIPSGVLAELLKSIISTIDKELPKPIPIVTAWTEGWGDIWKQIVEKEGLNIILSAQVTSIKRMS